MERRWFRADEISSYLSLNVKTVYDLCSRGVFPHTKLKGVGLRIDLPKLDELLEQHSIESIMKQLEQR